MAHTNKTTNYELPIFVGTDKPSWMNDWNYLTTKLDTTIKSIADAFAGETIDIETLKTNVEDLTTAVGLLETNVLTLDTKVTTMDGDVSLLKAGQQTLTTSLASTNGEVVKNKQATQTNAQAITNVNGKVDDSVKINDVVVLNSGWSLDAPFEQTILVSGMTDDAYPTYDVKLDQNTPVETQNNQLTAFKKVNNLITINGAIKLICLNEKPEHDFNLIIKGV